MNVGGIGEDELQKECYPLLAPRKYRDQIQETTEGCRAWMVQINIARSGLDRVADNELGNFLAKRSDG